jgi:hypothetical protein
MPILFCKRRVATQLRMADRLASVAMVVAFFFLPGVLQTVFGLFVCISLDTTVAAPYIAKAVVHGVGTACFAKGWHRSLSPGSGLPIIAFLCIGLQAAIAFITIRNRHLLKDMVFLRH